MSHDVDAPPLCDSWAVGSCVKTGGAQGQGLRSKGKGKGTGKGKGKSTDTDKSTCTGEAHAPRAERRRSCPCT